MENLQPSRLIKTRQGSIMLGIAAVVLAAVLLLLYLKHYRSSVNSSVAPTTVLIATKFFPAGTPAEALARRDLFAATTIPTDQVKVGAITDAGAIRGERAIANVYPGQQLTAADFAADAPTGTLSAQLKGKWRAIAMSIDAIHGMIPQIQTGDRVDVYVQMNARNPNGSGTTLGIVKPNVLVLQAPNQVATGTTAPTSGNYILRATTAEAPRLLYAAQNGTIWFVLRPQTKPLPTSRAFVTSDNIFAGPGGRGRVGVRGH